MELADGLYAVAVVEDAATVAELGDLVDGEQDAGFVVGPHEGDEGGVLGDGVLQVSHGEEAVPIHGEVGYTISVVLFQKLAVCEHRGVLYLGSDDMPFHRVRHDCRMDGGVVAFGAAAGEKDLAGGLGADEVGDLFPCEFDL